MMLQLGDIIVYRTKKVVPQFSLEWAIGFFTRPRNWNIEPWVRQILKTARMRHVDVAIGDVCSNDWQMGVPSVMGANLVTGIRPWSQIVDGRSDFLVYRLHGIDTYLITRVVVDRYKAFALKSYAFLQLLWYPLYRWPLERLWFDVRSHGNSFPEREVCSEQAWWILRDICDGSMHVPEMAQLRAILSEWRSSNFHPVDTWEIGLRSPALKFAFGRWDGIWIQEEPWEH